MVMYLSSSLFLMTDSPIGLYQTKAKRQVFLSKWNVWQIEQLSELTDEILNTGEYVPPYIHARLYFYTIPTLTATVACVFQGCSLLKVLNFAALILRTSDFRACAYLFVLSGFAVPNSHCQTWDKLKNCAMYKFRKHVTWEMNVKKKIPQFIIIFPKEANVGDTIWMANIIKKVVYDFYHTTCNYPISCIQVYTSRTLSTSSNSSLDLALFYSVLFTNTQTLSLYL